MRELDEIEERTKRKISEYASQLSLLPSELEVSTEGDRVTLLAPTGIKIAIKDDELLNDLRVLGKGEFLERYRRELIMEELYVISNVFGKRKVPFDKFAKRYKNWKTENLKDMLEILKSAFGYINTESPELFKNMVETVLQSDFLRKRKDVDSLELGELSLYDLLDEFCKRSEELYKG